ncbi:HNH/ENDO VII family nuclease [Nocardioides sp. LHG3406-4]|uniref:HNH/ENDO VII family nuclease n=1 Tax=Nocardioides sp. LHG3406-4 TaxID=2804575 RepID=UPI003CF0A22A
MRLDVDAAGYDSAAEAFVGGNRLIASAYATLTSKLGGYSAMGGDDRSSEDFVNNYDPAAAEVVAGIAELATSFGTLATVTAESGNNHRNANAGSVYKQAQPTGDDAAPDPQTVGSYTPPSSLGSDNADMPEFWNLVVDHLQGWAWPSADVDKLRQAAGTWRTMAGDLDRAPSYAETAGAQLSAQRSPEIALARSAVSDVKQASTDLAAECRSLAESCEEYATKVETTREVVIGLLKDLAIEIGATAVISGIASVFTFGGAAAVGAGVAVQRAISCARRIIAAIKAIKVIKAIGAMARSVSKVKGVRTVLRRFQSARRLRHKPTGKLPPKGRPGSYGYDRSGDRLPYANGRPSYGREQVDEVWSKAQDEAGEVWVRNKDGQLVKIEWRPGQPREGVWDMGHVTGREYRHLRDDYLSGKISKDEFLREVRDPDNYRVEHPGRNRSHVDEGG